MWPQEIETRDDRGRPVKQTIYTEQPVDGRRPTRVAVYSPKTRNN